MAATYSPTMQRSTIGDAGCGRLSRHALSAALAPLRSAALRSLSPLPSPRGSAAPLCARLRLYPAPLMHREDNGAAHSWDITPKGLSLIIYTLLGGSRFSQFNGRTLQVSLFRATARDDKGKWLTVRGYR